MKSLRVRALLDTNVFIYAYEVPESNSSLIIQALNGNSFEAVITESTFEEVYRYFRIHYSKLLADVFRLYMFTTCNIVFSHQLEPFFMKYARLIKRKDVEQLTAVRQLGIKYLVSYDKNFLAIEEHVRPKRFAQILGLRTSSEEF